jgi:hypothetical protein
MTAALAGKPVVGVGMQIEQVANLTCLERLGFAIRVPKSKDPSHRVQAAIQTLLHDESAKAKAAAFAKVIAHGTGRSWRRTSCLNITAARDRLRFQAHTGQQGMRSIKESSSRWVNRHTGQTSSCEARRRQIVRRIFSSDSHRAWEYLRRQNQTPGGREL